MTRWKQKDHKRLSWQHFRTMSDFSVWKTSLKGVKLKWQNGISLRGVLELLRKTSGDGGIGRVNEHFHLFSALVRKGPDIFSSNFCSN